MAGIAELTPEEREAWAALPVATIGDSLGRRGLMSSRIALRSGPGVVGRAFTVAVFPGDSASLHLALREVLPGAVLVVDAGGFADRAVWGEILTVAAQERGVVGAVIDGAVRDIVGIQELGFPLYCAGVSPAGPHKSAGGSWGQRISCGGAAVETGDLIVGDADGVAVVPWSSAGEVLAATRAAVEREQRIVERIRAGESSAELLGLTVPPSARKSDGEEEDS